MHYILWSTSKVSYRSIQLIRAFAPRGGSVLAGLREHDEHRVWDSEHPDWCRHRLMSVVPIVSVRVEGGYVAKCLLCGKSGSIKGDRETARGILLKLSPE